jgi:hypothetical protein
MGRDAHHLELIRGAKRRGGDELSQISAVLEGSAEAIFATTMCLVSAEALANDPEVVARIAAAVEALDETMTTVRDVVLRLSAWEARKPT